MQTSSSSLEEARVKPTGTLIRGEWQKSPHTVPVVDKYTGSELHTLHLSSQEQVNEAVQAASEAFAVGIPVAQRVKLLERAADYLAAEAEELADLICGETGKILPNALGEVLRTVELLRSCAGEALRLSGEVMPEAPGRENKLGIRRLEPLGVVAAIAPFNGPLILLAHKVGPAIAAGNAVIGKPAVEAPIASIVLFTALQRAAEDVGAPEGLLALVQGGGDVGSWLVENPLVSLISFTGGARTGEMISRQAGLRPTVFELGGNSAAIVAEDADLELAATAAVAQAFQHAGQVCISLQRVYVHESVIAKFTDLVLAKVAAMKVGDPRDPATNMGPLLREADAERIESWIREAVADGATIAAGGTRKDRFLDPTVLLNVNEDAKIIREEVFGPTLAILPYATDAEAVTRVNAGPYGLQAGVFTRDITRAFTIAGDLNMRGVQINDGPGFREDTWPYGGRKESGRGTEGPHWAIREMSIEKLVVISL